MWHFFDIDCTCDLQEFWGLNSSAKIYPCFRSFWEDWSNQKKDQRSIFHFFTRSEELKEEWAKIRLHYRNHQQFSHHFLFSSSTQKSICTIFPWSENFSLTPSHTIGKLSLTIYLFFSKFLGYILEQYCDPSSTHEKNFLTYILGLSGIVKRVQLLLNFSYPQSQRRWTARRKFVLFFYCRYREIGEDPPLWVNPSWVDCHKRKNSRICCGRGDR